RPAAGVAEGELSGPGPQRRKGFAGARRAEPAGDRGGPERRRQPRRDRSRAGRPQPPVPDVQDGGGVGVRGPGRNDGAGGAGGGRGVGLEADRQAGRVAVGKVADLPGLPGRLATCPTGTNRSGWKPDLRKRRPRRTATGYFARTPRSSAIIRAG